MDTLLNLQPGSPAYDVLRMILQGQLGASAAPSVAPAVAASVTPTEAGLGLGTLGDAFTMGTPTAAVGAPELIGGGGLGALATLAGLGIGGSMGLETERQMRGQHLANFEDPHFDPMHMSTWPGAAGTLAKDLGVSALQAGGTLGQVPVRMREAAETLPSDNPFRVLETAVNPIAHIGAALGRFGVHDSATPTGVPGLPSSDPEALRRMAEYHQSQRNPGTTESTSVSLSTTPPATSGSETVSRPIDILRGVIGHLGNRSSVPMQAEHQALYDWEDRLKKSNPLYQTPDGQAAFLKAIHDRIGVSNPGGSL